MKLDSHGCADEKESKGTILPVKLDSRHYSLFSPERGGEVQAYTKMQNSALLAGLCLH